jgi:RNA polymerase sigma-70 factor (ECF subfamily)
METIEANPAGQAAEVDESALVAGLRAGEEWAFELMIRTYGRRLLAVAHRFSTCGADAEDVVQSAYVSAFRSIHQFEGSSRLSTWLHRIVVNEALMRIRSRRRKREESIEELLPRFQEDGHHVEQFAGWEASADELLSRAQTRSAVRAAIAQLPEGYRTVLLLRDIEELSTQEVADRMSMTPNAVKVRLHRARQALAKLLSPQFNGSAVTGVACSHPTAHDAHLGS